MHELHEPQAQGKGNPDTGNSEITSSVPNNSELLEFSLPPRRREQCGKLFDRRKQGGGSPQRFCNQECRIAWHASQRKPACTLEAAITDPAPERSPGSASKLVSDFDWSKDEDSIVLRHQPAVAVYWNGAGGLTIRQERDWNQEEDAIIAIAAENVSAFVDKLTDVIGIPNAGK